MQGSYSLVHNTDRHVQIADEMTLLIVLSLTLKLCSVGRERRMSGSSTTGMRGPHMRKGSAGSTGGLSSSQHGALPPEALTEALVRMGETIECGRGVGRGVEGVLEVQEQEY